MSKNMIVASSKEMIQKTLNFADAYLIGITNFCVNMPVSFKEKEIFEIINQLKKEKKEVFVSLNKNMDNKDIPLLEKILLKLEQQNIDGIFFYDIALVNLKQKLNLKTELVWSQEHFTTNYATINYWWNKKVSYTHLSSEITLSEILEIKKNTKSKLIVPIFGYIPMFVSKRKLITNYKKHFKLKDNSKIYYMEEDSLKYPVLEDENGTYMYYSKVLNAKKHMDKLKEEKIDYLLYNSFLIDDFEEIMKILNKKNDVQNIKEVLNLEFDDAFFEKRTIYKVK